MKRTGLLALLVAVAAVGCNGGDATVGSNEKAPGSDVEVKTPGSAKGRGFDARGTMGGPTQTGGSANSQGVN